MGLRSYIPKIFFFPCFFFPVFGFPAAESQGPDSHFIKVDGIQRRYLLHLPPGWAQQIKAPVILMLHGGGGTPEHTGAREIDKYGDPKGFIVVYPEGLNRTWNDGRLIK